MGNDPGPRKDTSWLILEYVKTLMWPVVVLFIVVVYAADFREILRTREVDIGGVLRIGSAVENLNQQLQAELADLRELAKQVEPGSSGAEAREQLQTKINSIEQNFSREAARIQTSAPASPAAAPAAQSASREARASEAERRGFDAIVAADIDGAITGFNEAATVWPEYHNVSEIRDLLNRAKPGLERVPAGERRSYWLDLDKRLLTQYSWGMPEDIRATLRQRVRSR